VRAALAVLRAEPERLDSLREISRYFVERATASGFDVGTAVGAGVIPVYMPSPYATMAASEALMQAGIYVPPIVQAGVPKDLPRLRFFFSASHTRADVDRVVETLAAWEETWQEPVVENDNIIALPG
jgi:7-keto-8-aminopelargonate synthetase-like enzyme